MFLRKLQFWASDILNNIYSYLHNRSEWKHEVNWLLSKNKSEASAKTQSKSEVQLFIGN